MFSAEGRSYDEETLEYAWLLEVQLGKLSGKLTTPQLCHIVTGLETIILLTADSENSLRPPSNIRMCHHGVPTQLCTHSNSEMRYRCPSGDDIKYRMTRIAIDAIDLYLLENGTALHTWISPIRLSTCNLHGQQVKSGITGMIPIILIRHFVSAAGHFNNSHSNTNTTGSGRSNHTYKENQRFSADLSEHWLEVGSIALGPIIIEAATSLPSPEHSLHIVQHRYLRTHDEATKRLWFLWIGESMNIPKEIANSTKTASCGCLGGCTFFGNNRNGARFFKPAPQDAQDGINMAVYSINTVHSEPGFGQSLLHEGQLIFHTPPYSLNIVSLQEPARPLNDIQKNADTRGLRQTPESRSPLSNRITGGSPTTNSNNRLSTSCVSPSTTPTASPCGFANDRKLIGRRFSYTSTRSTGGALRDVPYARLRDVSPGMPSDTHLHSEKARSGLLVPSKESVPKSSASDSKLAVDYFSGESDEIAPQSLPSNLEHATSAKVSESEHSLTTRSESEERIKQDVQRTVSMTSENHSEAFFSADEELSNSRTSSLRHSIIGSGGRLARQDSIPQRKKFASDLSIVADRDRISPIPSTSPDATINGSDSAFTSRLSSHRSDHEIHTPEHRSLPLNDLIHRPGSTAELVSHSSFSYVKVNMIYIYIFVCTKIL